MSNITVSTSFSNLSVNTQSNTISVTSTPTDVVVGNTFVVTEAQIRSAISVTDAGGDGSLVYNNSTGVFTYTGSSDADKNNWLATRTTDNLTEGSSNLYFTTGRANSAIGAYTGNLQAVNTTGNITTTANVSAGNVIATKFFGDGSELSNVSTLSNAQAKAYIEANGLDATADITTTGNITALNAGGLDTHLRSNVVTGIPTSEGGGDKLKLTSGGTGDEFILLDQPNNKIELDTSGNIDYKARENNFTGNLTIYPYPGDTGGNIIFGNSISGIYGGPDGSGGYSDVLFGSGITVQGDGGSGNDITLDDGEVILTSGNVLVGNVNSSTDGSVRVSNRVTAKEIYSNTLVDTNHLQLKSTYTGSNVSLGHGNVALISNYSSANAKDMVIMNSQYFPTGNYGYGNIWLTRGDFANYSIKIEPGVTNVQGDLSVTANPNDSSTGNVSGVTLRSTGALGLVVNGNATIGGNLDVTGNINSETVVDLFVEDRNITMQYGSTGSPSANSQLFVDRGSSANTYIIWSEADDKWGFSNDGSNVTFFAEDTDGLSEGSTNLYYTNARFDTRFAAKSTSDLSEGTNLYFTNARANAAFVDSLDNITTAISSDSNITTTANVAGANFIGNVVGNVTGSPSSLAGLDTDDLSEGSSNLYFTTARANSAIGAYTGNLQAVNTTGNITTTANISAGNVIATFIGDVTGTATTATNATNVGVTLDSTTDATHFVNFTSASSGNNSLKADSVLTYNPNSEELSTPFLTVSSNLSVSKILHSSNIIFNGADDSLSNIANITSTANVSASNVIATTHFHGNGALLTDVVAAEIVKNNDTTNASIFYPLLTPESGTANTTPITDNTGLYYQPSTNDLLVTGRVTTPEIKSNDNLKLLAGNSNLVQVNKKITNSGSQVETTILDIDTDGYRITSADAGSANIASYTGGVKGMLILAQVTSGSSTVTTLPLAFAGLGGMTDYVGGQSGSTTYTDFASGQTIAGAFANASALGGVQNGEGWILFNATGGGFLGNFDRDTHVSSISGNTLTMNKNATATATTVFIMFPGVASSTQTGLSFLCDYTVGSYNFEGLQPYTQNYVLPDTLSNVTIDRTSVSDDFDLANVKLGHIADLNVGDNDYVRVDRGLLIGANAEPDRFSSRNSQSSPSGASMLGLTLEHDGDTEYAANNTPQVKFLINNYTANSILGMASTPSWASDFGSTNVTVDNQYLSAPAFNFKTLNSSKEAANGRILANTVVGSIVWNAPTNTSALDNVGTEAGLNTGSDLIHPPAGIKVRMASDQAQTSNTTAMDMYVQTSYRTSYRDGSSEAKGSIPRTFLANKEGNTVVAAKTDGIISLRPVRDYGDSGNASTFTENRYAHELHEYHSFLDAKFLGTKAGTLVEIQPKSGETGGSTNFNYDSKGNATLRLSVHEANNSAKAQWDITTEQSSGNLYIRDHTNSTNVMHFDGSRVFIDESLRLQNLSTTDINAIASPQAGDVVYNTTLNQICFYNGTAWQKVTSATM